MLDRLAQPLAQAEEDPAQLVASLDHQLVVALRFGDRLAQEGFRGAQVVVVAAHQREPHERARPSRAALGRGTTSSSISRARRVSPDWKTENAASVLRRRASAACSGGVRRTARSKQLGRRRRGSA